MNEPIAGELRRVFELASMRREAKSLQTSRQMARAGRILDQARLARQAEQDAYRDQYDARLEKAHRALIEDVGMKTRELTPPSWAAQDRRFDQQQIMLQAQRNVRKDYEQRIRAINEREHGELSALLEKSDRENAIRGKARDDFTRSVDRRRGLDRRKTGPEQ